MDNIIGICGECGNTKEQGADCCGSHYTLTLKDFKSNSLMSVFAIDNAKKNLNASREDLYLMVLDAIAGAE